MLTRVISLMAAAKRADVVAQRIDQRAEKGYAVDPHANVGDLRAEGDDLRADGGDLGMKGRELRP